MERGNLGNLGNADGRQKKHIKIKCIHQILCMQPVRVRALAAMVCVGICECWLCLSLLSADCIDPHSGPPIAVPFPLRGTYTAPAPLYRLVRLARTHGACVVQCTRPDSLFTFGAYRSRSAEIYISV